MTDYFWWIVALASIMVALTTYIFWGRHYFAVGLTKGIARNPAKVRRGNLPDSDT